MGMVYVTWHANTVYVTCRNPLKKTMPGLNSFIKWFALLMALIFYHCPVQTIDCLE